MLYHGTTKLNADSIKKQGFNIIVPSIVEVERNQRYKNKAIGSLGYGLYTFENNAQLAYEFASKYDAVNPIVFEINVEFPENSLLDLTQEDINAKFNEFCRIQSNTKHGEMIYNQIRKTRKVNIYAGIMIELFILFLQNKFKVKILGVKRWEETFLPGAKYSIGPNAIEVTIRNSNLVSKNNFKVLRKENIYES